MPQSQQSPSLQELSDFTIEIEPLHIIPSTELFYPDLTYATSEPTREIDLFVIARITLSRPSHNPTSRTESCAIIPVERISDITENVRYAADASLMYLQSLRIFTNEYKKKNDRKNSILEKFYAPSRLDIVDIKKIFPEESQLVEKYVNLWTASYEPQQFISYSIIALRRQLASTMLSDLKKSLTLAMRVAENDVRRISYRYYAELSELLSHILRRGLCCYSPACLNRYIDYTLPGLTSSSSSSSAAATSQLSSTAAGGDVNLVFLPQLSEYIVSEKDVASERGKEYAKVVLSVANKHFNGKNVHLYVLYLVKSSNIDKNYNNFNNFIKSIVNNINSQKQQNDNITTIEYKVLCINNDNCGNIDTLENFISSMDDLVLFIFNDYSKYFLLDFLRKIRQNNKTLKIILYPERVFFIGKSPTVKRVCDINKNNNRCLDQLKEKDFIEIDGDRILPALG